jgi:hypothetical protein
LKITRKSQKSQKNEIKSRGSRRVTTNRKTIQTKLQQGCECQISWFLNLDPEFVFKHSLNIVELTKAEREMFLMEVTMASLANLNEISRHKERKVFLYAFCSLEHVTNYQLKKIRHHVLANGVILRINGDKTGNHTTHFRWTSTNT